MATKGAAGKQHQHKQPSTVIHCAIAAFTVQQDTSSFCRFNTQIKRYLFLRPELFCMEVRIADCGLAIAD